MLLQEAARSLPPAFCVAGGPGFSSFRLLTRSPRTNHCPSLSLSLCLCETGRHIPPPGLPLAHGGCLLSKTALLPARPRFSHRISAWALWGTHSLSPARSLPRFQVGLRGGESRCFLRPLKLAAGASWRSLSCLGMAGLGQGKGWGSRARLSGATCTCSCTWVKWGRKHC